MTEAVGVSLHGGPCHGEDKAIPYGMWESGAFKVVVLNEPVGALDSGDPDAEVRTRTAVYTQVEGRPFDG